MCNEIVGADANDIFKCNEADACVFFFFFKCNVNVGAVAAAAVNYHSKSTTMCEFFKYEEDFDGAVQRPALSQKEELATPL